MAAGATWPADLAAGTAETGGHDRDWRGCDVAGCLSADGQSVAASAQIRAMAASLAG